jgi:hypothetical protein
MKSHSWATIDRMHESENEAKCRVRCHTRMCRYRGQTKDSSLYTLANVSIALCECGYRCFGNRVGEPCPAHWHTQLNTLSRTATVASIIGRFEKTHHVYYVGGLHDDTLCCRGDREKLLREGRGMRGDLEHFARSECNHPSNGSRGRLSICSDTNDVWTCSKAVYDPCYYSATTERKIVAGLML